MVLITIVSGAYKPTYNWGAPHCRHVFLIFSYIFPMKSPSIHCFSRPACCCRTSMHWPRGDRCPPPQRPFPRDGTTARSCPGWLDGWWLDGWWSPVQNFTGGWPTPIYKWMTGWLIWWKIASINMDDDWEILVGEKKLPLLGWLFHSQNWMESHFFHSCSSQHPAEFHHIQHIQQRTWHEYI